jgi:hypothetical protein
MLSDREREMLDEIHHELLTDDPDFARSFCVDARRLTRSQLDMRQAAYAAGIILAVLLCFLMLIAGASGPALFFAVAAGSLIWVIRRHRDGSHRKP